MSSASRPVIGMLSTDMTPGGQSRPHTYSDDARRKGDQLTSRMPEISSHCVSSHLCRSRACMFELPLPVSAVLLFGRQTINQKDRLSRQDPCLEDGV